VTCAVALDHCRGCSAAVVEEEQAVQMAQRRMVRHDMEG